MKKTTRGAHGNALQNPADRFASALKLEDPAAKRQTTISGDAAVIRRAKTAAKERGISFSAMVEEGIAEKLGEPRRQIRSESDRSPARIARLRQVAQHFAPLLGLDPAQLERDLVGPVIGRRRAGKGVAR